MWILLQVAKTWGFLYKLYRRFIRYSKYIYIPIYLLCKKGLEIQDDFKLTAIYFYYDWYLTTKNVTWLLINLFYLVDYKIWWNSFILLQKNYFFLIFWDQWCFSSDYISRDFEQDSDDYDDNINTSNIKKLDIWFEFNKFERGMRISIYVNMFKDKLWRAQIYSVSENETP